MKTTLRKFLQNVQKCQRDRQKKNEREREKPGGESFIVRKQYEGKSLIKNTKVVLFI